MYKAKHKHLLADKQFGSRKFKSAIYQCLNKHLFDNLVRFKHNPVALCSNNVKSCYDWITLLAATLCLCCLGGPLPMISSMIITIHEMEHHIWTKFGDSSISASKHTWKEAIGHWSGEWGGPSDMGSSQLTHSQHYEVRQMLCTLNSSCIQGRKEDGRVCVCQW